MPSLFEHLGRKAGRGLRKANWVYHSVAGSEETALAAEQKVGRGLAAELRRSLTACRDETVRRRCQATLEQLTNRLTDKKRRFHVSVVEDEAANAFALPGGFLFITSGLNELCREDPDSLAFILGHEMAHVVRRHAINRVVTNAVFSTLAGAAPARSLAHLWLKRVGFKFVTSAYSRTHEEEADEFAVRIMKAAGYDPAAGPRMLAKLQDAQKDQDSRPQGETIGKYFGSHPPLKARATRLRRLARTL